MQVIAYASRTLTESEKNYHLDSGKFEFLALKCTVFEKFRDYLIGSSCIVYTDNNPLTYVLSTAKLNATGCRWVAELADFHRENVDADSLSRMPVDIEIWNFHPGQYKPQYSLLRCKTLTLHGLWPC